MNPAPKRMPFRPPFRLRPTTLALMASLMPAIGHAADGIFDLGAFGGTSSDPKALSADGNVVVGNALTANNADFHAFRWTQAGGMTDLGTLGGTNSFASAVSADGRVVVGQSQTAYNATIRAFLWTQAGGMVGIVPWGIQSTSTAVSADGKVVAGYVLFDTTTFFIPDVYPVAFRWTQADGNAVPLGSLGGAQSVAAAVSADGCVVVGQAGTANKAIHAFRWTTSGGMTDLGTLGGTHSFASGVSADGRVVVGQSQTTNNLAFHAYRWMQAGGMTDLGTLGGTDSNTSAVSADGSVVVGTSRTTNNIAEHAFRWTQASGMVSLGTLGGTSSVAKGISGDGNVVVGQANTTNNAAARAFRWTQASGMQSVEQWLAAAGVTVAPSLATIAATATNANGSVVVGALQNGKAFYARVAPPAPPSGSPGSGLIVPEEFNRTLQGASYIPTQAIGQGDLVLNGLNGSPLRGLPAAGRYNAWVSGDWGQQKNVAGDGNAGAGEFGVGWGLSEAVRIRLAVGRTYSTQDLAYDGNARVTGTYVVPEIVAVLPAIPLYLTLSGYYNAGDADIKRGYLNAGTAVISNGSPDTTTSGARLRIDWLNALETGDLRLTPYVSISAYRGQVDGYTETGGGFPVKWDSRTERTSLGRLGADAAYPVADRWMLLGKLEGVHRFDSQSSGALGTILGLGDFTTIGLDYKQNWLRANIGVEGAVGPGAISVLLNASTETNGSSYWASASYRVDF